MNRAPSPLKTRSYRCERCTAEVHKRGLLCEDCVGEIMRELNERAKAENWFPKRAVH